MPDSRLFADAGIFVFGFERTMYRGISRREIRQGCFDLVVLLILEQITLYLLKFVFYDFVQVQIARILWKKEIFDGLGGKNGTFWCFY
jgi:hypothetical protein